MKHTVMWVEYNAEKYPPHESFRQSGIETKELEYFIEEVMSEGGFDIQTFEEPDVES